MMRLPTLASSMTPFPYSVDVAASLEEAAELMAAHQVRHLPVTREGRTCGVVAEQDLQLAARLVSNGGEPSSPEAAAPGTRVGDICRDNPYVVDIRTPLAEVALEISRRRITAAVVERKGKLAGIFTSTDIARVLGTLLTQQIGEEPPPQSA